MAYFHFAKGLIGTDRQEEGNRIMAEAIVIYTANANDITLEEVEEIATAIRGLNPNFDVQVEAQQRTGYGVTWFEVLRISLLAGAFARVGKVVAEGLVKEIVDIAVDWARKRFKKGRKRASRRPVYVAIYGPDGVIKSVVIKNATDEPEDRTEEDQRMAGYVSKNLGGKYEVRIIADDDG